MRIFQAILAGVAVLFLCALAQAGTVDRIVAVVNNEAITLSELDTAFGPYQAKVEASYKGAEREKALAETRLGVLNRMIDELLIGQQARKAGIVAREEDVNGAIAEILKRRSVTPEELQKALEREGTTLESYRKGIRDQLVKIRLVQREVKAKVAISDQEIGEYYRKHRDEYEGKEAVRIRQILLLTPKEADPAVKEKLRADAEELRKRLLEGEPFDLISANYSQGPAANAGGDIGYVEKGMILPEVEAVAFSQPVNQLSPVIESSVGFHIIWVVDRRGAGVKSIESAREEIREKLEMEKVEKKFEEWQNELRAKSHVEIKL
jgi:peptidyl-prolyl cis-trans isomerase SurA